MIDIDMNVWTPERIKQLRASMELTQEAFALKIGVTRVYVNYLEKGVRAPNKTLCILLTCMESKGTKKGKGGDRRGKNKDRTKNKRDL
jgi:DNA-binding XRE family transcriptional regulator